MNKKGLKKLIKESFEGRHIGYRRFFPLDIKSDPFLAPNTKPEQLYEGSDGNYMSKQNIESIIKAAEIINNNINLDEEQDDWVEDKLSKVAENMRSLRDFFENRSEEEMDEGIGISQTIKRGMNKKPNQD
jgi:hypothetical protein